jgi:Flp pilus assembly pilin Flp
MKAILKRLYMEEEGATMVEYAMMLALIGAALVTALTSLANAMGGKFTTVSAAISAS